MGLFDRLMGKSSTPTAPAATSNAAPTEPAPAAVAGNVMPRLVAARQKLEAKDLLGALAIYDEVLAASGDRAGALQATSPNAAFTVLITLEKEIGPASPSGKSILSQSVAARG